MKSRNRLAIASIILALFTAGFFLTRAYVSRSEGQNIHWNGTVGSSYVYSFKYDHQTKSASPSANVPIQLESFQTKASGQMKWTVLGQSSEGYRVAGQLRMQAFESSIEYPADAFQNESRFEFTIQSNGSIHSLRFPSEEFATQSPLIIGILRFFHDQYPVAPQSIGASWTFKEPNLNEDVSTRVILAKKEGQKFDLHKEYRSASTMLGQGQAVWDSKKRVLASIQAERASSLDGLGSQRYSSNSRFQAELRDEAAMDGPVFTAAIALDNDVTEENLNQATLAKLMKRRSAEKILAGETPASLAQKLATASKDDKRRNMPLYLQLKALFSLQEKSVHDFQAQLLQYPLDDERFIMLATALTANGHGEAQAVLREVIGKSDPERQERLIPNLSFSPIPDPETESFLRDLSQADSRVAYTAELALGTVAHQLRAHAPERSQRILSDASQKLHQAADEDGILRELSVIGNIGLPEQLETIRPYLKAESQAQRVKAVDSLRYIDNDQARGILVETLSSDQNGQIREVAAEALNYSKSNDGHLEQIAERLQSEKNLQVLKNLLRVLANHARDYAPARSIIESFSNTCAHPDLCAFVSGLVSGLNPYDEGKKP